MIRSLPAVFLAPVLLATAAQAQVGQLPPVEVIARSPLLGTGIDRDLVPAETHTLDDKALRSQGMPDLAGTLERRIPGVTLNSASGNPFQPTLFYHGYAASPLQGTPQGLAVYVNGMRFNQPFGDTVYWDLLPDVAIDRLDLVGSNPLFGLNALGGAIDVRLKDGFRYQGFEAAAAAGSFNRLQGEFQYGQRFGGLAAYVAGSVQHESGWRDLQSSDLQTVYVDLGWQGPGREVHINVSAAHSFLNGPGTSPVELLAAAPKAQFTAPNAIENSYGAVNFSGSIDAGPDTSIQTLAYYRYFRQAVVNGNAPNDVPCNDGSGLLCFGGGVSTSVGGTPIGDFLNGGPYGQLDTQNTLTHAYGMAGQVTTAFEVLGRKSQLIAGAAYDGSSTRFQASTYIGGLTPLDRVFVGPGLLVDEPGTNSPVSVAIATNSFGFYASNVVQLSPQLALTLAGRLNLALVNLHDLNGGDLEGLHTYAHFNPSAGLTYKVAPWLTLYGSYAVANRVPTPAELSCAGPQNACSLANFFVGDPDLRQVVSQTFEAGLRGTTKPVAEARLKYNLSLYRSDLDDDIAFVNSPAQGRAFFANIGRTRRQGIDAEVDIEMPRWSAFVAYGFIDATYQTRFVEGAGNNPAADANGNITVNPGKHLPGIPSHQVKAGASYKVTDKWTVGATVIGVSSQYLFGDEANLTPPLPGYVRLDLQTRYEVSPNVQLFAWARNVTNASYYTYGTFSPTTSVPLAQAASATDTRSYSPASPLAIYAGLRVLF
ncbi:MAG TPA: TonB-dependent receptor [Reyranella sp.]|jgi:outer membrane receptor protein involved in Fe transport